MSKITDLFKIKEKTFSIELFPPKTEKGFENLLATIDELITLKPDFISCTYGAGGGNRDKTFDIVELIQKKHNITSVAHLTCVLHTKDEIRGILKNIKSRAVENILALRGDPPAGNLHWKPGHNNFRYSNELCAFAREEFGDYFGIGVAGFPEGHLLSKSLEEDAKYLKLKIESGADYVITQLFFDNKDYYAYCERLKAIGVTVRIIPGILPITNYQGLLKFCKICGATVNEEIKRIFEPIQDNPQKTLEAGIAFAVKQGKDLLKHGAPGLHFYSLNKFEPTATILKNIK